MNENRRVPLGDRVSVSLRNWLGTLALRRRSGSRADALGELLAAARTLDEGGGCPLRTLELSIALQGRGVDAERLLQSRLRAAERAGGNGRG